MGVPVRDQPVLCDDKVRFIGDPVVLVAAETLRAAEEAIRLIRVDYDDLPGIFSPEDALAPGAAKIHETGNVVLDRTLIKGNFDQALAQADVVIQNTYRTRMVHHACLEPGAGVATYDGDKVTVWMPSKEITVDHEDIAASLGLPLEKVRVIGGSDRGRFRRQERSRPRLLCSPGKLQDEEACQDGLLPGRIRPGYHQAPSLYHELHHGRHKRGPDSGRESGHLWAMEGLMPPAVPRS